MTGLPSDNIIQSTFTERMEPGRAGVILGGDQFDADTGICETVAGLAFGIAVSQGSADKGVVIGGTRAGFRGITIRDITLESSQTDKYARYQNVGVMTRGKIWCTPSHAVAAGDAVYFVAATGVLTNQSGGNQGPINGARFVTTAVADALAIVELTGYQRSS